jgi:hypothetical protein
MGMKYDERLHRIEKEAKGFAAWCREFVAKTEDSKGVSLNDDFFQFLGELEASLDPAPVSEEPTAPVRGCAPKNCIFLIGDDQCMHCGWSY